MHSQYAINAQVPTYHYNKEEWVTPVVEFSEGIRPAGNFMPSPHLPLVRKAGGDIHTEIVVSTGKVVALDSQGYLVPAGLLLNTDLEYTSLDVERGILKPDGTKAAAGDKVKDAYEAAGITVSNPVGVASYNFFRHPGGNGENPLQFNYSNLNYQNKVVFVTDYVLELPLVTADDYKTVPMKGIAAFIAEKGTGATATLKDFTTVKPGDFVTFDKDSNFVVDTAPAFGRTIGQVIQVVKPNGFGMLGQVRSPSNGGGALNQMPGTANGGVPEKMSYANGYGLVRVNLITR